MRIGHGYDVHRLVEGRDLVLGGVKIDYHLGLLGHSDADVLVHAIMDALLGATALGDIGKLFPDSDDTYRNADSLVLLKKICKMLLKNNYKIENIDSTVIAQAPKLSNYISKVRKSISFVCDISVDQISVKATTEEGLGYTGKSEGIAAYAVVLVSNIN